MIKIHEKHWSLCHNDADLGYQEKGSKEIIWKEGYEEKVKEGTLE